MILLSAVRARLLQIAALTSLVDTRVYSMRLPQNLAEWPAVLLQEIDRGKFMHQRGGVRLYRSRVQLDAIQLDGNGALDTAHDVAHAANGSFVAGVPTGLLGYTGVVGGVQIAGVLAADQRERYESGVRLVKVEVDYFVWFRDL